MPGCSGPELAQLIRLQDEWLSVPIIYLSSETDSERQLAALVKGGGRLSDQAYYRHCTDCSCVCQSTACQTAG